jgi:hypothetical protein
MRPVDQVRPELQSCVPPSLNFLPQNRSQFRQRGFWIVTYSASKPEFLCRNPKGEFPYISRELNLDASLQPIKECDIRGREIAHVQTDQRQWLGRTESDQSATFRQKNSVERILPYTKILQHPGHK